MNKKLLSIVLLLVSVSLEAQVLRDTNFKYLYNPDEAFTLTWDVVREQEIYTAFYDLKVNDTSSNLMDLKIQWEVRKSISEKTGPPVNGSTTELVNSKARKAGLVKFSATNDQTILVAKVTYTQGKKTLVYLFQQKLPATASFFVTTGQEIVTNLFITRGEVVTFHGFNTEIPLQLSYYEDAFPAAAPSFSTAQARVSKTIRPDSIFHVDPKTEVSLTQKGLYLAQQDTTSALGVTFRVEDDYPKLGKLESLVGPLVYVCTKEEYQKLKLAGNDKKNFDQVILGLTGNTERARIFMRNYFKRVEAANQYFSSYKEGWKTDRGMVYIIYGIPDEVYLFDDREVWEYKNDDIRERFQFVKSVTIFDPENYVLIRDKSFTNDWYNMIDLWRKARF